VARDLELVGIQVFERGGKRREYMGSLLCNRVRRVVSLEES